MNDYDTNYPNAANDIMNSMDNTSVNNEFNNVTTPFVDNNISTNNTSNDDFTNFLNNYDNNQPVVNNVVEEPTTNYQPNPSFNNPVINEVVPPVTSNFNTNEFKYVEDDARYNDITKPEMLTSVDEIIAELQVVVDRIKNNSKFKIDTDEINFDDIYQITIKIDKRDIL